MTKSLVEELKSVATKRIDPLVKRREELQAELKKIDAEIATAQRAIDVLDGKAPPATNKPSADAKPAKRRNLKASASVDEVLKVLAEGLKKAGGKLGKADLLDETKETLRAAGYGLTGLKQRVEKLLGEDDQFVVRGNSVSLNTK